MKHWSEFLLTRTQATNRLGKIARTLTYEVQEKEMQLQNAKANLERLELNICNKIASNYTHENDFENAIENAKHKADIFNNEFINNRK
ncbi:hypothetical protein K5L04_10420 [Flavobacterium psychrophilum]|uniref:hypothetical protein n=1 Tax=Flavobacterium psychrophilum TaxID=96345 RepID=UPI001C8F4D21|nr:hypothetical protein [Flavobacterium psychrophilum]QZL00107.1 hypothetical protein K5L04_10420 [Flavobacterium psychrophilum]